MIPKTLHFCYGLKSDFGGKPWGLSQHVCVASAIRHIRPTEAYFYYEFEPTGPWWELTKSLVTSVPIVAPTSIFDNPLDHPAHRADVVRLQMLLRQGGIYLDTDVVVHKSFDDLLENQAVLGTEGMGKVVYGTANAVILSEKDSQFLKRWYSYYKYFRGSKNKYWSEHSVQLPNMLAKKFPDEIRILGPMAFFYPTWLSSDLQKIFNSVENIIFPETYATHLWDGRSHRWTKGLLPRDVRRHDTNFHRWAVSYLEGLPDDYGEGFVETFDDWTARRPSGVERAVDRLKEVLFYEPKYRFFGVPKFPFDDSEISK